MLGVNQIGAGGILALSLSIAIVSSSLAQAALAESRSNQFKRAEKELREGDYEEAAKIYRKLLKDDNRDNRARLGLALVLLKQLNYQGAYDLAGQAIAYDPLNARAHALLGTALLRSGDFKISVEEFRTALQIDEREALAVAGLAEVDFYENRVTESLEGLRRASFLDPYEPDYLVSLARSASRLERFSTAADAYQRFLEIAPKTDSDRRERIKGLIAFFRFLGNTKLHRVSGEKRAIIPFKMYNNRPFIKVKINGKDELTFVVDTGAGISVISQEVADKLGVKPVASGGRARAVGGSGTFPIVYSYLDSMSLGGIRLDAVPIYLRTIHHAESTPEEFRAQGYLGLSILWNFITAIDYKNQTMELEVRDSLLPVARVPLSGLVAVGETKKIYVPFRSTNNGLLSGEVSLDGSEVLNFIIDTGATTTAIAMSAVEKLGFHNKKSGPPTHVIGAAGIAENVDVILVKEMEISDLLHRNVRMPVLDFSALNETSGFKQSGILGGDFLRHFRVEFDFQRALMALTPQTEIVKIKYRDAEQVKQ